MEFDKMSENLQKILMNAVNDAKAAQHASVDTIDVLEAMFKSEILDGLFDRLNVDKKLALTVIAQEEKKIAKSSSANINLSSEVQKSIDAAAKWAGQHDEIYLSTATLWIFLMFNKSYIPASWSACSTLRSRSASRRNWNAGAAKKWILPMRRKTWKL